MSEASRYSRYEPLFGSWHICRKIGQGAIGQVFEIERKDLGTTYKAAMKAITIPEGSEDIKRVLSSGVAKEDLRDYYSKLINNIANEFKYLAKLKGNSYIVNYEDHQIIEDPDEFRWYILIKTELLTPLVEHTIEHPLSEHDVLELGIDICRALTYCGQYNILHRDIKPENIFISPSGDYKLGDFGIARMVEETYVNLSRKGTYTYMAPEVFHGQKYDQSADMYSLGLVMYKYLNNGRVPFMPPYPEKIEYYDTENAFTERLNGKAIPEPQKGSSKLRRIVLRACAYSPDDRYENAEEMLADLEEIYIRENRKHRPRRKRQKSESRKVLSNKTTHKQTSGKPVQPEKSGTAGNVIAVSQAHHHNKKDQYTDTKAEARHNSKRRWWRTALTAAVLLIMIAAATYTSIPKEVTDITGIDEEVELYYDGTISPEYGVEPRWFKDEPISFTSSDDSVFTVTDDGEIEAASIGEADLTMAAKEYKETVHVVVKPKVTAIKGIKKSYSLYIGDSVKLSPELEPKEFAGEPVSYKSSDKAIASINKTGKISASSAGEVKISITAGGTQTSTTVTVTEKPVEQPVVQYSAPTGNQKSSSKKTTKTKRKKSTSSKESFGDEEYFGG